MVDGTEMDPPPYVPYDHLRVRSKVRENKVSHGLLSPFPHKTQPSLWKKKDCFLFLNIEEVLENHILPKFVYMLHSVKYSNLVTGFSLG